MTEQPEVICGTEAAFCRCGLTPGHDGPHTCGRCGGQWYGTFTDDDFKVVRFPRLPDPTSVGALIEQGQLETITIIKPEP